MTTILNAINILNFKEKRLAALRKKYGKKRYPPLHLSDLDPCQRQHVFQIIDPDQERRFTGPGGEKTLKYFHGGEKKHKDMQDLLDEEFPGEFDCEKKTVWNGIELHPDIVSNEDGAVIELKTSETDSVLEKPHKMHVERTKKYMAILGAPYGIISYMIMGKFKSKGKDIPTFFPEHVVEIKNYAERKDILNKIEHDAKKMIEGIETKNPGVVPHIAKDTDFMQYGYNWMCAKCDYKKECDKIREEAGEFRDQTYEAIALAAERDEKIGAPK